MTLIGSHLLHRTYTHAHTHTHTHTHKLSLSLSLTHTHTHTHTQTQGKMQGKPQRKAGHLMRRTRMRILSILLCRNPLLLQVFCLYVHTWICMYMCTHIYVCLHIACPAMPFVYMYIYIYICMFIHCVSSYTHTHTHTHTHSSFPRVSSSVTAQFRVRRPGQEQGFFFFFFLISTFFSLHVFLLSFFFDSFNVPV